MEYLFLFFGLVLLLIAIVCIIMIIYALIMALFIGKQWDLKMEKPPPPPKKKCSSCDGTGTMILDKTSLPLNIPCLKCVATGYINYGYQPTNKVDTSNPPKQTAT